VRHERTFELAEPVELEVLIDGDWHPGVLRTWSRVADEWVVLVTYTARTASPVDAAVPLSHVRRQPREAPRASPQAP
jgi:hypothetical protein